MNDHTKAPMNLLDPTASVYLLDLHHAAQLAKRRLDEATIAAESPWLVPAHWKQSGTEGSGAALNSPLLVVLAQHDKAAHDAASAARDTYRQVVGWYARAATLALEAVLADGKVTARELEQRTLHRLMPNGRPARDDDWWEGKNRPPLPTPEALATGHEDIDRPVRETHEPLAAAYRAADEVAGAEEDFESREDGYVADWEASLVHDAAVRAQPLWKLLHEWADAVSFAASHGRSRARGHQPAGESVTG
jgi:hypothetical protein